MTYQYGYKLLLPYQPPCHKTIRSLPFQWIHNIKKIKIFKIFGIHRIQTCNIIITKRRGQTRIKDILPTGYRLQQG
jgi:hypothetical protein